VRLFCDLVIWFLLVVVTKMQVLADAIPKTFYSTFFPFTFILGTWWTLAVPDIDLYTTTTILEHLM